MEPPPKNAGPIISTGQVAIVIVDGALDALNAYRLAEYAWRTSIRSVGQDDLRLAHDEAAMRLGVWIGVVAGLA